MTDRYEYFDRVAELSVAAAGVHAIAAAIAATSDIGAASIDVLRARGMTEDLERELLGSGLIRVAGGGLVVVEIEPLTRAEIAELRRLERERVRGRQRRQKAASSGQTSADAAASADAADAPQIAGSPVGVPSSTSLTRARMGAPHTPVFPPLLNIVSTTTHTSVEGEKKVVARASATVEAEVLEILAQSFTVDELTVAGVRAGIAAADYHDVPALAAAYMAAAKGASKSWQTRDAGATLEWAARKLSKTSAPPGTAGPARRGGEPCPGPGTHAAARDQLLAAARPLAGDEFELWLGDLQVHAVGERLVVAARPAHATWISGRFADLLTTAAGRPVDVVACSCASSRVERRSA